MEERIKQFVAMVFGQSPDAIEDDTRPATLPAWDSVQHLILVASLEEEFQVNIEPEEIVEMYDSFRALRDVMLRKIEGAA